MIEFGLLLLAFSVGDALASGLAGIPDRRRDIWDGVAAAFAVSLLGGWLAGFGDLQILVLGAAAAAITAGWVAAKGVGGPDGERPPRHPALALWLLAVGLILAFSLSGLWAAGDAGYIGAWFESLPSRMVDGLDPARLILGVGVLLFLTAPANGIVRAVLSVASDRWIGSEASLRGGRFIGVLERWLVFGFVVAGDPTAAALVVSAKSLLRFPEVSRAAGQQDEGAGDGSSGVDSVTEYFLLGSLTSWAVAFGVAVLF